MKKSEVKRAKDELKATLATIEETAKQWKELGYVELADGSWVKPEQRTTETGQGDLIT